MFQLWSVKLAQTETALSLAAELMTKAGYQPTKRERGIAEWKSGENSNHNCFIWFRSFKDQNWKGCVGINACSCKKPQPLQELANTFKKEAIKRELLLN